MVARMRRGDLTMARPTPNFVILDRDLPDVGRLVAAMLKARQAVETPRLVAPAGADHEGVVG
jgi:hypothetical protein